ncbi:electron transfer flavoprotein subunit beta/FixA family protein [Desulfococcaceae bacterium HSG9]|nr:electron transfer flavoprotein subunit beta/FixA family protein [Desulfococcaceae bacterium HSG9]
MKKIIVLAKQVPDTANITGQAMKEDGTVNRAALPAVFNPDDLNAMETALTIKDTIGAEVIVITMGPPAAVAILKHALYMGADRVMLISDRKFAGADTLATSYVLAEAVKKIGAVDLVLAGRQAIDGDTAQVGPQVAEKIGFNQITYITGIETITENYLIVTRDGELQTERIKTPFPMLLTITDEANTPRYPNSLNMLKYFRADTASQFDDDQIETARAHNQVIPMWKADDLELDIKRCGIKGSPTRVSKIENITLTGGDLELYGTDSKDIKQLVHDLRKDYAEVNE